MDVDSFAAMDASVGRKSTAASLTRSSELLFILSRHPATATMVLSET